MYADEYTEYLRALGYHGVYTEVHFYNRQNSAPLTAGLHTTFWYNERRIAIRINFLHGGYPEEKVQDCFMKILSFAETDWIKQISDSFQIHVKFYNYLCETGFFGNTQLAPHSVRPISVSRCGVEYLIRITIHSNEQNSPTNPLPLSLDEYRNSIAESLTKKCELDLSPDLRSLKAQIRESNTVHTIQITSPYTSHHIWLQGAALFINSYQTMLNENMTDPIMFLKANGFFDISIDNPQEGYTLLEAFYWHDKYIITIETKDELPGFDNMDGPTFEQFCAKLLSKNGFSNIETTQNSGDQGVDIIAYKDEIKYGIQCKRYSSDIGNRAVQEVYSGKTYYNCHVGVVLTNRYFTKSAIELALHNGVILWNRDKLLQMVDNFKGSNT